MLAKEIIMAQFAYNKWANTKIMEKARLVDEDRLKAPSVVEGRSLYDILHHLARVETVWRMVVHEGDVDPSKLPTDESLPAAADIAGYCAQEAEALKAYLDRTEESELGEGITITRWDGQETTSIRYQLLLHMFMHSMQHRSEAAVLLTVYGHSPGNIDALFFFSD